MDLDIALKDGKNNTQPIALYSSNLEYLKYFPWWYLVIGLPVKMVDHNV